MTKNPAVRRVVRRVAFPVYIVLAAAFLLAQTLQGLSFLDIGMYLAGYLNFNSDPWSCYYLGQWFLTYKLTGSLCSLLGAHSFMALRLMAVALNVAVQCVVYLYVRRYVARRYAVGGLALATLACFGGYTDINYNDYSVALLTVAVVAYHSGLYSRRGAWLVAAAGVAVGVAFFFRVVNLTFLALPLVGMAVSRRCGAGLPARRQPLWFGAGCAAGCAGVLLFAWGDGSLPVLAQTARDLVSIGGGADDPHSLKAVAISAYTVWKGYVAGFAPVALLTALLVVAGLRLGGARRVAAFAGLALLIVLNIYFSEPSANVTAGVALAALAFALFGGEGAGRLECLFALSLLVPLAYPIGSNGGTVFFGQYVGFLSTPLALALVARATPALRSRCGRAWPAAALTAYFAACAALLAANAKRPLMEDGTRMECRYTVDSPATGPILTTGANAAMYGYLLAELRPMVPQGSYMVCNFSLPMVTMMGCKPYAVFSDVFTSDAMNSRYIAVAHRRAGGGGHLPLMLLDREAMTDGFRHVESELRSIAPYRTAWTDGRYELLVAGE